MSRHRTGQFCRRYLAWPVLMLLLVATGCEGGQKGKPQTKIQGADKMITYAIGRFAIDIPAEMKLDHQGQTFRYTEIDEVVWPADVPREKAREAEWESRLVKIKKLRPPRGKDRIVLETRDLPALGAWAKAVLYYNSDASSQEGDWEVLVDTGSSGVRLRYNGLLTAKEEMLGWVIGIAKAYQSRPTGQLQPRGNWFYTPSGGVDLPFLEQESVAARFSGHPLGLKFEIQTNEIHRVEDKGHNLLGRLAAVLATGYNAGVGVEKIRTGKRTVAGLAGEEIITRLDDQGEKQLSFMWRYAGEPDSGERPEVLIEMEAENGKLQEKMKVWDAVLDTMKPMYR